MNAKDELKLLQEIEELTPPVFHLLSNHTKYDKDFKKTNYYNFDIKSELKEDYNEFHNKEIYVRFDNEKKNKYFKEILKYETFEGLPFFVVQDVRSHLEGLSPKALI